MNPPGFPLNTPFDAAVQGIPAELAKADAWLRHVGLLGGGVRRIHSEAAPWSSKSSTNAKHKLG